MIRLVSFILVTVCVWWLPLSVSWLIIAAYSVRYSPYEVLAYAIFVDWWLQPTWPVLSLVTAAIAVAAPFVRARVMLYTR